MRSRSLSAGEFSLRLFPALFLSDISRRIATTANCTLMPSASIMQPSTFIRCCARCDACLVTRHACSCCCSKYLCYGGYTGWVVLDMQSLALDVFPALSPRFICNGMAADSSTRSVICTSLGQSSSWRAPTAPALPARAAHVCAQVSAVVAACLPARELVS